MSSARKLAGSGLSVWPRRRAIVTTMAGLVLLPIEVSEAGWLSHLAKSPSKQGKSSKRGAMLRPATLTIPGKAPKRRTVKLAALGPAGLIASDLETVAATCDPSKFRIVIDVGHTPESEGAISARNVAEFIFNLRLAQRVVQKLKAEGFAETRLLVTPGKARPSLFRRVAAASDLHASTFLSVNHDSVPDRHLEKW